MNDRDEVRRAYIQRGSYQPHNDTYPQTILYGHARRFNKSWYDKYSNWLEYSLRIKLVVAYVFICLQLKVKLEVTMEKTHSLVKVLGLGIISKDSINILGDRII